MLPGKVGGRALYTFKDIPTMSTPAKPRKPTSPRSMTQARPHITIQTVAQHMTFHQACYERASELWQPDDSYCTVDPDFPEMAAWLDVSGRPTGS